MIFGRLVVSMLLVVSSLPAPAEERPGVQRLVVTNQNLALVTEHMSASLPQGSSEFPWQAAASARTETWSVTTGTKAVRWLGLIAPIPGQGVSETEWLGGLVGRQVRIQRPGGATVDGEVLGVYGATPAQILFREGTELVYGEPEARISVAADAAVRRRPSRVTLKLESDRTGTYVLTSRYLVGDVTWEASYSLTLATDEKQGRLEGWFVVDNRSGAEFAPVQLRLLAGTLKVTGAPPTPMPMAARAQVAAEAVAPSEPVSESRMYDIETPPRLVSGRTTFPLVTGADVAVDKRYVVRSSYWFGPMEEAQRIPVAVQYRVETKPLARALPAGVVRVYAEEGEIFVGEDRIGHTPEKTDVAIETSEAFDLSARRRQVSFQQSSQRESESAYEVVITSRKKDPVTVLVREQFPGDWTVVESSVPPRKLGAYTAEFAVPVPAGGEAKLTYRVRVRTRG